VFARSRFLQITAQSLGIPTLRRLTGPNGSPPLPHLGPQVGNCLQSTAGVAAGVATTAKSEELSRRSLAGAVGHGHLALTSAQVRLRMRVVPAAHVASDARPLDRPQVGAHAARPDEPSEARRTSPSRTRSSATRWRAGARHSARSPLRSAPRLGCARVALACCASLGLRDGSAFLLSADHFCLPHVCRLDDQADAPLHRARRRRHVYALLGERPQHRGQRRARQGRLLVPPRARSALAGTIDLSTDGIVCARRHRERRDPGRLVAAQISR
jgi:hypothetical protein